jgi:trimeric autotransporter adhesin
MKNYITSSVRLLGSRQKSVKTIFFLFSFFYFLNATAQTPQAMSYQAVIRNASNVLVTNAPIGMKISILQSSASGTPVFVETQTTTTNANGLASIAIGSGTVVTGSFAGIDWANGPYFIKTETDPTGGTSYTITGTSQLLSVPYALYAATSGNSNNTWNTYGNIGTNPAANFVGTTDDTDLTFKRHNTYSGSIRINNTSLGYNSLSLESSGQYSVAVGSYALGKSSNSGTYNTAVGNSALESNSTGNGNSAFGRTSLGFNQSGEYNSGFGYNTLGSNKLGNQNTAIGTNSLGNIEGSSNTSLGYWSLAASTSGDNNIGIGNFVSVPNPTGSNQMSIGNVIYGADMNANAKIGIGVPVPTAKLEVNGFTKLGSNAPAIKVKKLTGTTGSSGGDITFIDHNLDSSKILSVSVLVNSGVSPGQFIAPGLTNGGISEYFYYINATNIAVQLTATNSTGVFSQPIKILVTYEE